MWSLLVLQAALQELVLDGFEHKSSEVACHPFQPLSWSSDGDEVFSEVFKTWDMAVGLCLEVKKKMVRRIADSIDDSLIAGNASSEGLKGRGT
ncbi:hypothetical protein QTO34_007081 [Cnephaeus nilssonii]|uniref:TCTP domain-containing protein n=1 Tax=Cnephaeus nilssonii TaxID=3371016 RepID=A0AA40HKI5_CNENI|nr:hypothetical protein QTO34_007081 [Eptesicus nilssonii]